MNTSCADCNGWSYECLMTSLQLHNTPERFGEEASITYCKVAILALARTDCATGIPYAQIR